METGRSGVVFDPEAILFSGSSCFGTISHSSVTRYSKCLRVLVSSENKFRFRPVLKCIRFRTEIPRDARVLFVDVLAELRPCFWNYVPKLAYLFDALFDPSKLRSRRFKIETVADDDIRNAAPDSDILINAFEYIDSSIAQTSADVAPTPLPPSLPRPNVKENTIEASRLGLFDDTLTYFYIRKVNPIFENSEVMSNIYAARYLGPNSDQ